MACSLYWRLGCVCALIGGGLTGCFEQRHIANNNDDIFLEALIQRHGESMTNVGCSLSDPLLTKHGVQQAQRAHEFVVSSPDLWPNISFSSCLVRAMQTAAITFGQTVHVSDFLPEAGFGAEPSCLRKPGSHGSCAVPPNEQLKFLQEGRPVKGCEGPPTPLVAQRLDWSWQGGQPSNYETYHQFNWTAFLERLWDHQEVRNLVMQNQTYKQPALISITTHGLSMAQKIFSGDVPPIQNTAIYLARLPLRVDTSGSVLGFEMRKPMNVTCKYKCPHADFLSV